MRVILLENDYELEQEITELLYMRGVQVDTFDSIEGVEEALKTANYDLIIADFDLQMVDRFSQLPRIYNEFPNVEVILTTTINQSFIPHELKKVISDCFEKPFTMNMLEMTLDALINKKDIAFAA